MKLFSKDNLLYFRNNLQLVYAVVLLILVPAALVLNSVIFIDNTQKVMDVELQRKASLANSIFSVEVPGLVNNEKKLQDKVIQVIQKNEELHSLDVLVPKGEDFEIVASADTEAVGNVSKYLYNTLAWRSNEAIAYQTTSQALSTEDQSQISDERFWVVVKPVSNEDGEKAALVSMKISSKVIDDLTRQNLNRSIIVLIATIVVIILLLANNTRLFQYAAVAKRLREVDMMKDEFISMVSHELRTPITGIKGYLKMLIDKSFGELPEEAEEKLRLVSKETDRLSNLVNDLLDVSRIQQGRLKFVYRPVNVSLLTDEIIASFAQQAKDKGLALKSKIPVSLPPVRADEEKLQQIIVNLVSNAIKYTQKGSVVVEAKEKQGMVSIKVSDTGIGMSAQEREHLFEKFYRVRNEKTDAISGSGLGLWISRELARIMKGEIYVESIENVGTHVTVVLPVYKEGKNK